MTETAESGKQTFKSILALRQEIDAQVITLGKRAENVHSLLGTPINKRDRNTFG